MSLYPSLEDMKVDQMARAQAQAHAGSQPQAPSAPGALPYPIQPEGAGAKYGSLYPSLTDYMGLDLTSSSVQNAIAVPPPSAVLVSQGSSSGPSAGMIAPLSGQSVGLKRAEVTHGIRESVLCKDGNGKIGMRVQAISKGVFVALVHKNTPAAVAGLRFGDQILQINGENVAGYSNDKVHGIFKKCANNNIVVAVRDRPFERTITLHKDSTGHIGFIFKKGKIISIVKESSAARNGLLIDHHLLEVNGQNVVGLNDKDVSAIFDEGGQVITITIMPSFVFEHMIKHMASSLVTKKMDHSIPDM